MLQVGHQVLLHKKNKNKRNIRNEIKRYENVYSSVLLNAPIMNPFPPKASKEHESGWYQEHMFWLVVCVLFIDKHVVVGLKGNYLTLHDQYLWTSNCHWCDLMWMVKVCSAWYSKLDSVDSGYGRVIIRQSDWRCSVSMVLDRIPSRVNKKM